MKSIKSVKVEVVNNFTPERIFLLFVFAVISIILVGMIGTTSGTKQLTGIGLLIGIWSLYIKYLRDDRIVNKTRITLKYYKRSLRGETIIAKYKIDTQHLKKVIPIRQVHGGGLIEFNGKQYGVLLITTPSRKDSGELIAHQKKVEALLNTLHGTLTLKSITGSRIDPVRPLDNELLKAANQKGVTLPQRNHLHELYTENTEKAQEIDWTYHTYIGFGQHDNVDRARITMNANLPGIIALLKNTGISHRIIEVEDEVLLTYRELLLRKRLK